MNPLMLIATGAPLTGSLEAAAEEAAAGGRACVILLTDPGGDHLHIAAAAGLGGEYPFALDGMVVGPDAGPSGRAIWRGTPVVADDADARCAERTLADRLTLPGCWAAPLPGAPGTGRRGAVLLLGRSLEPAPADLTALLDCAALAAIAVDRERDSSELGRRRTHDPLTGLVNRATILEQLRLAIARSRQVASAAGLLLVDLDRFKAVNDSLGHEAGDRLLVAVAERLKRAMRPGDSIGRLGADEFVVVCEDVGGAFQVMSIAKDVADVVARPFALDGRELFLTASIGVAVDTSESDAEGLLRDADAATARAKSHGPNHRVMFDENMRSDVVRRMEVHTGLKRALERRELTLVFQPEVELATGRVVGAEALVRWEHPEKGVISPLEFIPAAEDNGLIVPIGAFVLHEACAQIERWAPLLGDRPFTLWVNVSGRQLSQPDLPEIVADALLSAGADASRLGLEITESAIMEDAEAASAHLHTLRRLGVRLAIDDFGTGYSSLAYLKRFPVDILKVDRSFVNGIVGDPDDGSIVAAVVGLARVLGKDVVAEGVEGIEQIEALLALGCRFGQGYHFARPQPPDVLEEWLAADYRIRPVRAFRSA